MSSHEERDKDEIINCIIKFYQLIGGSCTDRRDWSEFSKLFAENATLSMIKNVNEANIITLNVQGYISMLQKYLENNNFWERGSDFQVTVSNHIASVNSIYEASPQRDFRTTTKRGTNFIQLVKTGDGWKVLSMLWEDNFSE